MSLTPNGMLMLANATTYGTDQPSTGVAAVQRALQGLAVKAKWSAVDPGRVDGVLDLTTFNAISTAVAHIQGIPGEVKTVLTSTITRVAIAAGWNTSQAAAVKSQIKSLLTNYGPTIAKAIDAWGVLKYGAGSGPPAPSGGGNRLPSGSIRTIDSGRVRLAIPIGTGLQGCTECGVKLLGSGDVPTLEGLGAFIAPTHTEIPPDAGLDTTGVVDVPVAEFNLKVGKKPFYKQGWFWGVVGATVVVGSVATFFIAKK